MEELKNCTICGKFFEPPNPSATKCNICAKQDDEDFNKIRDYLYLHPLAKIFEVSSTLDISLNKIKRYLREGRIEIAEKDNHFLKCDSCGKPICSGTHCDECQRTANSDKRSWYAGDSSSGGGSKINYRSKDKLKSALKR